MNKSAKEMFEKLGYEYYEDDGFNCYKKKKSDLIEPDGLLEILDNKGEMKDE